MEMAAVARLVEYQILLNAGVPSSATHLLSNHYNETRSEYYRRLDRSSKDTGGVMGFLVYALQGFADGLKDHIDTIKEQMRQDMWTNYVHMKFRDRSGRADTRRRHLVLDLSERDGLVRRGDVRLLTPRLAEAYAGKTEKTITRDLNELSGMGLIVRTRQGILANNSLIQGFTDSDGTRPLPPPPPAAARPPPPPPRPPATPAATRAAPAARS